MKFPDRLRRIVFRQRYRKRIRQDQEEFLREHPELRLPVPMHPTNRDLDRMLNVPPPRLTEADG